MCCLAVLQSFIAASPVQPTTFGELCHTAWTVQYCKENGLTEPDSFCLLGPVMGRRGRLSGFWVFVYDYAKCTGRAPLAIPQPEASNAWQALSSHQQQAYKSLSSEHNRVHGESATKKYKQRLSNLFHHRTICRNTPLRCGERELPKAAPFKRRSRPLRLPDILDEREVSEEEDDDEDWDFGQPSAWDNDRQFPPSPPPPPPPPASSLDPMRRLL